MAQPKMLWIHCWRKSYSGLVKGPNTRKRGGIRLPFSQPDRYCNGIIAAGQSTAAAGVAPVTSFRITPEPSVQKLF